jgi:hypothetical protein
MAHFDNDNIEDVIANGIVFGGSSAKNGNKGKRAVKSKAKKKAYITGSHGSGAAKKKADIRTQRANRHR